MPELNRPDEALNGPKSAAEGPRYFCADATANTDGNRMRIENLVFTRQVKSSGRAVGVIGMLAASRFIGTTHTA